MRFFKPIGDVCQRCIHGNNKKGKFIEKRFSPIFWNIYCERKGKFYKWDRHKRCFVRKVIR